MSQPLSASAHKIQQQLHTLGFSCQVVELPDSTRTAQEAAQAIGVRVEQIVKSLIFKAQRSGKPLLVLVSGTHHVNEKRLDDLIGEPIGKADADFVCQHTGFAVGGVPRSATLTLLKPTLMKFCSAMMTSGLPPALLMRHSHRPAKHDRWSGSKHHPTAFRGEVLRKPL